jgi:cytochrome c oxidase cbb3-type subunit I
MHTDAPMSYPAADRVSRGFFVSAALGLLILVGDGLLLAFARVAPYYGFAQEMSQLLFWRGRPIHLQLLIFAWLSMALMGAIYYVVPRMVRHDLFSAAMGRLHLLLQWVGIAAILGSLHYGYTTGREYLEPVLLINLAVVVVWTLFAGNIFTTVIKSRAEQVSHGLKFILVSILYLGLNYVIANFIPLTGVKDDLMVYTFAHNEVNGWFMFGLMGIMYWTLPRLVGVPEKEAYSAKLTNWHFWLLMILIPPSVLHHFLYEATPIIGFWKQVGMWSSVAMLAPTAIWAYIAFKVLAKRRGPIGVAGGFYVAAMVYYLFNCVQGAAQSVFPANEAVHQTQWVVGHAHLALIGWISMGLFGVLYQLVPEVSGRAMFSERLGKAHFLTANAGFVGLWLALSAAGVIEAVNMGKPYVVIEDSIVPLLAARAVFGVLFAIGSALFAYNVVLTRRQTAVRSMEPKRAKQIA